MQAKFISQRRASCCRSAVFQRSRSRRRLPPVHTELNWQPLVERRRHARLVMFYKIHYQLASIRIPLTSKFHLQPTRTENIFAYNIHSHHLIVIIIYSHSFHELFGTGIRYLRKSFSWELSKFSDVPFLPSRDCWSAPCTCCVGSHCF